MGRKYKLNVTRPEFLLRMMSDGDVNQLDEDNMRMVMHDTSALSYVVYTVLMEANLKQSEIFEVSNDGEAIAVKLESKNKAKKISEICKDATIRYGYNLYEVKVKVRDEYLIFTAKDVTPEEDDEEE